MTMIYLERIDLIHGAVCRSCGAKIRWGVTKAGKQIPINTPVQTVSDEHGIGVDQANTHWATCPNAAQHRRRRKV